MRIFQLTLLCLTFISCKTTEKGGSELRTEQNNCQDSILLQDYLQPRTSCVPDNLYVSVEDARKRDLAPWIPCNDVEWVDDTPDLFGADASNSAAALAQSTYARIFRDWLGAADRFTADSVSPVFKDLQEPLAFNQGNPILESALGQSIKGMIQSAQSNIVMDIFLLGGSWGADIMHDLAAAADRGVEVILLHDNVSKFSVANEMDPLWQAALVFSMSHPKFTAMEANIHPPKRVSSIPFGLEKLSAMGVSPKDLTVSAEGRSDHSKLIIVDALYQKSLDEYLTLKPKALIGSRNMVDSASAFYHDEVVIVKGPAAVVTLLNYQSDLVWALNQAKAAPTPLINTTDESLLQSVLGRLDVLRRTPTRVKGQGGVKVQPIQISANDEVRNLDSGIIPRIMAAEHSIDLYNKIAYNWPLAIALKEAMARGVKVRVILDQQNSFSALGNSVLPYMLTQAPRRVEGGGETTDTIDETGRVIQEADLPVRWFVPFRPGKSFASKDRSDLAQEIHAKTIIIDGQLALFGSVNFDSLTWAGGFREYSVWIDDPAVASASAREFDRLWNHPLLTVSHRAWLGVEAPAQVQVDSINTNIAAVGCDTKAELCDITKVLQGGKDFPEIGPKRELMRRILSADSARIRALLPAQVLQNEQGIPQCRTVLLNATIPD